MEQDRYEEYKESLEDTGIYPDALETAKLRLIKRIHHRNRQLILRSFGCITGVILLFTFIVNSSTVIASALLDIPVIGTLAEYVSFDYGLKFAVDNKSIQEINLTEESNGYTLGLPYVIADSRRLVLFFQLPKYLLEQKDMIYQVFIDKPSDIIPTEITHGYSCPDNFVVRNNKPDDNGLIMCSIRTTKGSIPKDLKLNVSLKAQGISKNIIKTKDNSIELADCYELLGNYVFDLHLGKFAMPKIIELNKDIEIMDQTIHLNSLTEYSTGTEIRISIPETNTSIINGIEFKATDKNGNIYTQKIDLFDCSKTELSCYLNGNYSDSTSLDSIQITGLRMYKNNEKFITIDLLNKTLTPQPTDLTIKDITFDGSKADVTMEIDSSEMVSYFYPECTDLNGTKYNLMHFTGSIINNKENINFSVISPTDKKVVLKRYQSPMIKLDAPVAIDLNH